MIRKIKEYFFPIDNRVGLLNSSDRGTWIKQSLERLPSGLRILDAGSGKQPFKKYCSHLNYVSQDFAQYNPNENQVGIHIAGWEYPKTDIISDIIDIPELDNSFDVILCTEVIEHIPNPVKALVEFKRLLKKSGYLILTAPFCSLTHFAPYHYSTGFNKYFYEYHLNELGFDIKEVSANGNYFEYMAQEIRRVTLVCEEYTNKEINLLDKLSVRRMINLMGRLSTNQKGSEKLLNFGFHVFAQKQ